MLTIKYMDNAVTKRSLFLNSFNKRLKFMHKVHQYAVSKKCVWYISEKHEVNIIYL